MSDHHIKKVGFLLQAKELSLDIWLSRKALKRLSQNIYLMLDLFYKRNPLITTVADDRWFKTIT